MAKSSSAQTLAAARLEEHIRALGAYEHVTVRARGPHLNVEVADKDGVAEVVARASPLGSSLYGLAFRSHTGRWDPLPSHGSLGEIAKDLVDLLGPYLDPTNLT